MDRSVPRARTPRRRKSDSLRFSPFVPGAAAWGGLPERDRALLRWLLVGDVMTSELASVLAYGSLRSSRRRLARLVDLGLLRGFWAANRQRPRGRYAYALVSSARAELERTTDGRRGARRRDGPVTTAIHQLATNDLLAAFLRSAMPADGLGLVAWLPERAVAPLFDGYVIPDALAIIGTPTARIGLFVERDLGTESTRVVASKVDRYRAIFGSSHGAPVNVGIVVESARRAASLRLALARTRTDGLEVWVAVATELLVAPYAASWAGPDGRRSTTVGLPGEPSGPSSVVGSQCLVELDAVEVFEPVAVRELRSLQIFVREPGEGPA